MHREIKFRAWWPADKKMDSWKEMVDYQTDCSIQLYFVGENPDLLK